ncbi:hypothetical protein BD769DRAFT_1101394 [Suillus cothurnatus]|nr:hypothetical protein BD769DRAFT_1101394 [Suillus cothurnatus]
MHGDTLDLMWSSSLSWILTVSSEWMMLLSLCSSEEIREPKIDLSSFLAKQRLTDVSEVTVVAQDDEEARTDNRVRRKTGGNGSRKCRRKCKSRSESTTPCKVKEA